MSPVLAVSILGATPFCAIPATATFITVVGPCCTVIFLAMAFSSFWSFSTHAFMVIFSVSVVSSAAITNVAVVPVVLLIIVFVSSVFWNPVPVFRFVPSTSQFTVFPVTVRLSPVAINATVLPCATGITVVAAACSVEVLIPFTAAVLDAGGVLSLSSFAIVTVAVSPVSFPILAVMVMILFAVVSAFKTVAFAFNLSVLSFSILM